MKKKLTALFLALVMCTTLNMPAIAVVVPTNGEEGIAMSVETFESYYTSDDFSDDIILPENLISHPKITYENFVCDTESNELSFSAQISHNNAVTNLNITGTLYNSSKQNYGIDSIIGVMKADSEVFSVLHFEIYNSYEEALLSINPDKKATPCLRLYLLNSNGVIYFFETDIPSALQGITIEDTEDRPNVLYDGLWFLNCISAEINTITSENGDVQLLGTATYDFEGLILTTQIAGVTYRYYTTPHVLYKFSNVTSAISSWSIQISMANSYYTAGGYRTDGPGIQLQNVQMSIVTGLYTQIIHLEYGINFYDTSFETPNISAVSGILSALAAGNNLYKTSAALALLSILWTDGSEEAVTFKDNATYDEGTAMPNGVRAVCGEISNSRYVLFEDDDEFLIRAYVESSDYGITDAPSSSTQSGLFHVAFTASIGTVSDDLETQLSFNYNCTL